jgi:hypothetical protein
VVASKFKKSSSSRKIIPLLKSLMTAIKSIAGKRRKLKEKKKKKKIIKFNAVLYLFICRPQNQGTIT